MEIVATFVPDPARAPAQELAHPPAGATMVELRADLLGPELDFTALTAASPLPVILTLRSAAEGGRGPDDPVARRAFYSRWAALPVALFDLEGARDADLLGDVIPPERVILSEHVLGETPADLEERARRLLGRGTRLAKLAPAAGGATDALAVLRLAQAFERGVVAQRRLVTFATGEAGRATRLLAPLLAAPMAYACWGAGREAAPGQYAAEELLALTGHLQGRPRRVFAVLGGRVGQSLSPRMHAAAYSALGLPNLFMPLDVSNVEELADLLAPEGESALDRIGLVAGGFAVTMPWKEAAARRCDVLAPRAQRAGVANTVLPRHHKVLGDCTDIDGIVRVVREAGVTLAGSKALVLGTGGAARAAVVALQLEGARVALCGRSPAAAAAQARRLDATVAEARDSQDVAVVVNATPAGGDGASDPFLEGLRPAAGTLVIDLPYGEKVTFLGQLGRERGWDYVGGLEVLLYQGLAQIAAMTSVAPPVRAMAAALGLEEVQG